MRTELRASRPRALTALIAALALTAAACSNGAGPLSDPEPAAPAATPDATAAPTGEPGEPTPTEPETALVLPTDTDEPPDLSGGATSSDDGVTIEVDNPLSGLDGNVRQATAPWPTDWSRRTVDLGDFLLGIPTVDPRDRIPPIDLPKFEPIANATWLGEREPGALVQLDGEVRFYPLSILTRHEIVNDRLGDIPVAVTYCPLCNTAIAFDARVDGQALRFGVSGLLRNSDLVMWDSATASLWQQITGEAVVGTFAGTKLELVSTAIVSYSDALENFPDALSLSRDTGFPIDYGINGYVGYSSSSRPFAFQGEIDDRFPPLSRVVGVSVDDESKAFPFELISDERAVNDELGGVPIAVLWGGDTADALDARSIADSNAIGTAVAFDRRVDDQVVTLTPAGDDLFTDDETGSTWTLLGRAVDGPLAGRQLATVTHRNEFWFAWASFFPDADVYEAA